MFNEFDNIRQLKILLARAAHQHVDKFDPIVIVDRRMLTGHRSVRPQRGCFHFRAFRAGLIALDIAFAAGHSQQWLNSTVEHLL